MTKTWEWLKKAGIWIVGLLLIVLGGGWLWHRERRARLNAEDEAKVAEAQKNIERLRGVREAMTERVDEKDAAIKQVDEHIEQHKQVIRRTLKTGAEMSADEIAEEFRRLGL